MPSSCSFVTPAACIVGSELVKRPGCSRSSSATSVSASTSISTSLHGPSSVIADEGPARLPFSSFIIRLGEKAHRRSKRFGKKNNNIRPASGSPLAPLAHVSDLFSSKAREPSKDLAFEAALVGAADVLEVAVVAPVCAPAVGDEPVVGGIEGAVADDLDGVEPDGVGALGDL